jgi:tetratricopeptide (TPR) repeat protein
MKQFWMILLLGILITGSFPTYAGDVEQAGQLSEEIKKLQDVITKLKQEQLAKDVLKEIYSSNQILLKEVFSANLQSVNTYLSVLNVVIIIILGVFSVVGFLGLKGLRELKRDIEKDVQSIKEKMDNLEKLEVKAKEAEEDINFIRSQRLYIEAEITKLREKQKDLSKPSLEGEPHEKVKKQFDEIIYRLKFLEEMGVELSSEDYVSRGRDFYLNEKYELALQAYNKAVEIDPANASAWFHKGLTLGFKLKKYDEAISAYQKAIELKPDFNSFTQYNLACTYSRKGEKAQALSELQKAIELTSRFKERAKEDEAFQPLWEDKDFKRIVGENGVIS